MCINTYSLVGEYVLYIHHIFSQHPLLLGQYIQFLLVITQWLCPIFLLRKLLRDSDLEDIFAIAAVMMTLAFDHFIVQLKGQARPGHAYVVNV